MNGPDWNKILNDFSDATKQEIKEWLFRFSEDELSAWSDSLNELTVKQSDGDNRITRFETSIAGRKFASTMTELTAEVAEYYREHGRED